MHISSNRPVSEDEKADDVISRRHLYCGTPVVTSWAVAGQQVVFLHMYLQTRVTLRAFPVATPRGRSSSSHEGEPLIYILLKETHIRSENIHNRDVKNTEMFPSFPAWKCISLVFYLLD